MCGLWHLFPFRFLITEMLSLWQSPHQLLRGKQNIQIKVTKMLFLTDNLFLYRCSGIFHVSDCICVNKVFLLLLLFSRAQSYAERLRLGLAVIHGEAQCSESDMADGRHSPPCVRNTTGHTGLELPCKTTCLCRVLLISL